MRADVAVGDGAEDRIHDRMKHNVGIRMSGESAVVRNLHAAEPDVIAAGERMHVVARSDAHVGEACDAPRFGAAEIVFRGQLGVALLAGERGDLQARPFDERCVVGEIVAAFVCRAAVRVEERGELERLRRLHAAQLVRSTVPVT